MLEQAIVQLLTARPAIITAVPDAATRTWLHPNTIPQTATKPALAYQIVSSVPQAPRVGDASNSLTRARVQLTIWSVSYLQLAQIAMAIRLPQRLGGLVGWRGELAGVRLSVSAVENAMDEYEPDSANYMRMLDMIVWHNS